MSSPSPVPLNILTISLYQHLHNEPISTILSSEWTKKTSPAIQDRFNNIGFDLDPTNEAKTLQNLRNDLRSRHFDGVTIGWCTRGNPQRTDLFEKIIDACTDAAVLEKAQNGKKTKLMFSTGPEDLVETTLRNFPIA